MSFMNVCHFVLVCLFTPFGYVGGMWDLIVLIPDLCFLFTLQCNNTSTNCRWPDPDESALWRSALGVQTYLFQYLEFLPCMYISIVYGTNYQK